MQLAVTTDQKPNSLEAPPIWRVPYYPVVLHVSRSLAGVGKRTGRRGGRGKVNSTCESALVVRLWSIVIPEHLTTYLVECRGSTAYVAGSCRDGREIIGAVDDFWR